MPSFVRFCNSVKQEDWIRGNRKKGKRKKGNGKKGNGIKGNGKKGNTPGSGKKGNGKKGNLSLLTCSHTDQCLEPDMNNNARINQSINQFFIIS